MIKQNKMASMLLPVALMASVFSFSNSFCIEVTSPSDEPSFKEVLMCLTCLQNNEVSIIVTLPKQRKTFFDKCYNENNFESKGEFKKSFVKELNKALDYSDDSWFVWFVNKFNSPVTRGYGRTGDLITRYKNYLQKREFYEEKVKKLDFESKKRFDQIFFFEQNNQSK